MDGKHWCPWSPTSFALLLVMLSVCTTFAAGNVEDIYPSMFENVSRIYWIHLPKSGGTALAQIAMATARDRRKTFAFCYQARGEPDCSQPATWTKQSANQAGQVEFRPPTDAFTGDHRASPYIVFGHFTMSASAQWMLPGDAVHVIMIRYAIRRYFLRAECTKSMFLSFRTGTISFPLPTCQRRSWIPIFRLTYTRKKFERLGIKQCHGSHQCRFLSNRHPIDRFFSGFMQNRRAANNRKQALQHEQQVAESDLGQNGGFDMETFVDSCISSGNRMMMVGPLLEYLGVDNLSNASSTRELVAAAKRVIDDPTVVVLVYEWYEASIRLLEKLGVTKREARAKILNATPRLESLRVRHSDLAKIRRCVLPEEEVYVYAVDVFRAKYERITGEKLDPFPMQ
eukprot:m.139444 g.139444  ORF g.139444 m.139444 type:complete len:398 (-) comp17626_c0_seq7:87-1280(-)